MSRYRDNMAMKNSPAKMNQRENKMRNPNNTGVKGKGKKGLVVMVVDGVHPDGVRKSKNKVEK